MGSVRSQKSLSLQQLRCVRDGWPADVHEEACEDAEDPNLHSHGCCTLEGLFAVDWDVSVGSAARSGQSKQPAGQWNTAAERRRRELTDRFNGLKELFPEMFPPNLSAAEMERCVAEKVAEVMRIEVQRGSLSVDGDTELGPSEEGGEGEASDEPRTTRRSIMGEGVCGALEALEEKMLAAGAVPADFRLLICFDN